MTKQHEQWLKLGAAHAEKLLAEKATYGDAIDGLMFFYTRKVIVMHGGTPSAAGRAVQIDDVMLARRIKRFRDRGMALTPAAQQECERWATLLALNGAKYREALFVFTRSVMETAIAQAGGNRCEAARRLKVHRNTMWRVPKKPGRTAPHLERTA